MAHKVVVVVAVFNRKTFGNTAATARNEIQCCAKSLHLFWHWFSKNQNLRQSSCDKILFESSISGKQE